MTEKTCEQRVRQELKKEIATLKNLWQSYCDGEEFCEAEDTNICEYGLCFDYVEEDTFTDQSEAYFRYQISYGGPSDEFRFFVNPDFSVERVEYWFLDWFDGAYINLSGEELILLKEIFDWFKECGTVQSEYDKKR